MAQGGLCRHPDARARSGRQRSSGQRQLPKHFFSAHPEIKESDGYWVHHAVSGRSEEVPGISSGWWVGRRPADRSPGAVGFPRDNPCRLDADSKGLAKLSFTNENGIEIGAKFDGADGNEVIDRKTSPFSAKAADEAQRQVAVANHFGLQAVWELPNSTAAAAANRFMEKFGITDIVVRQG
jgi:hypothetical protein